MAKNKREEMLDAQADSVTTDEDSDISPRTNGESSAMTAGGRTPAELALALEKEQMSALENILGLDASEIEVIAGGRLPFWPAIPGNIVAGTIDSTREVPTQWGTKDNPKGLVTLYTMTVERQAMAQTLDGEIFTVESGEQISILERSVLKELQTRIGQRVAILCVGKKQGKVNKYWDYRVIGQKRTPEQVQAAAMMTMAKLQQSQSARALPPSAG